MKALPVIPFLMAFIQIPFFPNMINVMAFGMCVGLGIAQVMILIQK